MGTQTSFMRKIMRVEMALNHVFYISYLVPESRVRGIVPEVLPLSVVDRDNIFVSVVILQSARVRLSSLPWLRPTTGGNSSNHILP